MEQSFDSLSQKTADHLSTHLGQLIGNKRFIIGVETPAPLQPLEGNTSEKSFDLYLVKPKIDMGTNLIVSFGCSTHLRNRIGGAGPQTLYEHILPVPKDWNFTENTEDDMYWPLDLFTKLFKETTEENALFRTNKWLGYQPSATSKLDHLFFFAWFYHNKNFNPFTVSPLLNIEFILMYLLTGNELRKVLESPLATRIQLLAEQLLHSDIYREEAI
jgi:hypothetical protein